MIDERDKKGLIITKKDKTRCDNQWTEARFISFVKGVLRRASWKWAPTSKVFKEARVERGKYMCAGYDCPPHVVPVTVDRKKNVSVDHVSPVVGDEGFIDWNEFINNLYCDSTNLQVLCRECHDKKSLDEKKLRNNKKDM